MWAPRLLCDSSISRYLLWYRVSSSCQHSSVFPPCLRVGRTVLPCPSSWCRLRGIIGGPNGSPPMMAAGPLLPSITSLVHFPDVRLVLLWSSSSLFPIFVCVRPLYSMDTGPFHMKSNGYWCDAAGSSRIIWDLSIGTFIDTMVC